MSNQLESSKEDQYKKAIQKSLIEIRNLREKLKGFEEPIAIVGMACRFPGGIRNTKDYWKFLSEGKNAISDLTDTDRWDFASLYSEDRELPGKICSKSMGLVYDIDQFDANFFGLSAEEVIPMDPQHRLLLTVTQECIEDAGYTTKALAGRDVGVYVGICTQDYSHSKQANAKQPATSPYDGVGNAFSAAAGRISYIFDFNGPCAAIETACSSSLVALHQAISSLRLKESEMAVVGGVNALLEPELSSIFSIAGMLSPDGRCKTFDESANGYVRAEGCGMVMLKRLSDAEKDKDQVYAVIKGSATNQDGRSLALTSPSEQQQINVIEKALRDANATADQISYIEAHGTGTWLGDSIEITALNAVFEKYHDKQHPLYVGSAKTNLGHMEGGAGVAGIIKTALSLQHQKIPQHLHFTAPNRMIPWRDFMTVPTKTCDWDYQQGARLAGVSSFGFSGVNVHVVLEEHNSTESDSAAENTGDVNLAPVLKISAKTQPALLQQVNNFLQFLQGLDDSLLDDFCYTANAGRDDYRYRVVVAGDNKQALIQKLQRVAQIEADAKNVIDEIVNLSDEDIIAGDAEDTEPKIAFIYPHQSKQYQKLGLALYENAPKFKKSFDECVAIFSRLQGQAEAVSINGPLQYSDSATVEEVAASKKYQRQFNFCIQYGLTKLCITTGIKPKSVLAYGCGEYMGACLAGVVSLEDACKLVSGEALESVSLKQPIIAYHSPVIDNQNASKLQDSQYWVGLSSKINDGVVASDISEEINRIADRYPLIVDFSSLADDLPHREGHENVAAFVQLLDPAKGALAAVQHLLVKAFCAGVGVKWRPPFIRSGRRMTIPYYPFQNKKYWHKNMPYEINK